VNLTQKYFRKLKQASIIWLMLDYDGTLADFARSPDEVLPDSALIELLKKLCDHPQISLAIISGRRLAHIEKLVPLSGVWLAGSYGIELRTPKGQYLHRTDFDRLRPSLERLKPEWEKLIDSLAGFYLEDKGWSLALHARFADDKLADQILIQSRTLAQKACSDSKFQILGGNKFLEIAPNEADKGNTIRFLLQKSDPEEIFPIYIGDDDKDERAFPVVQSLDGLTGCVCHHPRTTLADFQLQSPAETRQWLEELYRLV
jgi:trehalose-phosphatase